MTTKLTRIRYADLNGRQRENYNFHKISAVLADFGFTTLRLNDDWQGADFIAQHVDGETFIKVQLKSRFGFDRKYVGKNLHIAFGCEGAWYLYPHDEVLETFLASANIRNTASWRDKGVYHFSSLTRQASEILEPYRVGSVDNETCEGGKR